MSIPGRAGLGGDKVDSVIRLCAASCMVEYISSDSNRCLKDKVSIRTWKDNYSSKISAKNHQANRLYYIENYLKWRGSLDVREDSGRCCGSECCACLRWESARRFSPRQAPLLAMSKRTAPSSKYTKISRPSCSLQFNII